MARCFHIQSTASSERKSERITAHVVPFLQADDRVNTRKRVGFNGWIWARTLRIGSRTRGFYQHVLILNGDDQPFATAHVAPARLTGSPAWALLPGQAHDDDRGAVVRICLKAPRGQEQRLQELQGEKLASGIHERGAVWQELLVLLQPGGRVLMSLGIVVAWDGAALSLADGERVLHVPADGSGLPHLG